MHWSIPAKTFLLGEYAALMGQSAIILTTQPCFEVRLSEQPGLHGIHPESPAGQWWRHCALSNVGVDWHDPYQGIGGLGASSAQFIGVYQACAALQGQTIDTKQLLATYRSITANPKGLSPSGYDVHAQLMQGCVYLNRETACCQTYPWPFTDLGFIIIHTQHKTPTHQHLQSLEITTAIEPLVRIVESAKIAFDTQDSEQLVAAVQAYHQALCERSWVAPHSLKQIAQLQLETSALAIKGCGAMGADVLLILLPANEIATQKQHLTTLGWSILATNEQLLSL